MPIETTGINIFEQIDLFIFVKVFFVLFVVFYAVFSLMLFRQVQIMSAKLPTALSPLLKFVGIVHIGISIAVLFFVVGSF